MTPATADELRANHPVMLAAAEAQSEPREALMSWDEARAHDEGCMAAYGCAHSDLLLSGAASTKTFNRPFCDCGDCNWCCETFETDREIEAFADGFLLGQCRLKSGGVYIDVEGNMAVGRPYDLPDDSDPEGHLKTLREALTLETSTAPLLPQERTRSTATEGWTILGAIAGWLVVCGIIGLETGPRP